MQKTKRRFVGSVNSDPVFLIFGEQSERPCMLHRLNLNIVILLIVLLSQVVVGCGEETELRISGLENQNDSLWREVTAQDSIMKRIGLSAKFVDAYLDSLSSMEETIKRKIKKTSNDSAILDKVRAIRNLATLNRKIVDDLKQTIGDGNIAAKLLLDHVLELDDKVKKQEYQIALLQKDLKELGGELSNVLGSYAELETKYQVQKEGLEKFKSQVQDLESKLSEKDRALQDNQTKLNTVYYFFGNKKELMALGIVEKEGLFNVKISDRINLGELNKADLRTFKELTIPTSGLELLSNHPKGSFTISRGATESKLYIKDTVSFWSITNTLVVQTE